MKRRDCLSGVDEERDSLRGLRRRGEGCLRGAETATHIGRKRAATEANSALIVVDWRDGEFYRSTFTVNDGQSGWACRDRVIGRQDDHYLSDARDALREDSGTDVEGGQRVSAERQRRY